MAAANYFNSLKIFAVLICWISATTGIYLSRLMKKNEDFFNVAMAMAAGVILSAGSTHMLPDAEKNLNRGQIVAHISFPFAEVVSGMAFVLLVLLEEWVAHSMPTHDEPHTPTACAVYRAQFAMNPRKELITPSPVVCKDLAQTITGVPPKGGTFATDTSGHCCPVHRHDFCLPSDDYSLTSRNRLSEDAEDCFISQQANLHAPLIRGTVYRPSDVTHEWSSSSLFLAMSFHSVMEGLGLGVSSTAEHMVPIFMAIVAHKGVAGFALGTSLLESKISREKFIVFSLVFSAATPLGALAGSLGVMAGHSAKTDIFVGICTALASGTFLQVATMELLPRALADENTTRPKRRLRRVLAFMLGFIFMSLLAIWV